MARSALARTPIPDTRPRVRAIGGLAGWGAAEGPRGRACRTAAQLLTQNQVGANPGVLQLPGCALCCDPRLGPANARRFGQLLCASFVLSALCNARRQGAPGVWRGPIRVG